MILIADGGSTKTDWICINNNKKEVFRLQTLGLNPSVIAKEELKNRVTSSDKLSEVKNIITEVHFYGAGCGTLLTSEILSSIFQDFFSNAKINVAEDTLAAVYASAGIKPAIVCILGTGSNSCFFNGNSIDTLTPSLGYTIMDEASGNYFGKILLRDFYYKKMPLTISNEFQSQFNLDADFVKLNLYRKPNPNMYLASFAKFMIDFKDNQYIKKTIEKGFNEFFEYRILPFDKPKETPIYFIGSIAFYFSAILEKVADQYGLKITDVIQRPIDNLLEYHKNLTD